MGPVTAGTVCANCVIIAAGEMDWTKHELGPELYRLGMGCVQTGGAITCYHNFACDFGLGWDGIELMIPSGNGRTG